MPTALEKLLADPRWSAHRDYLHAIAKPSVSIQIAPEAPQDLDCRFGGSPMVPADFVWPTHAVGLYKFLGQFNFAQISNRPELLPDTGMLSLFYAEDEYGDVFWGDEGYVLGFYWPQSANLLAQLNPYAKAQVCQKLSLTGALDYPRHCELRTDWPFDTELLAEFDALLPREYLLGYPSNNTLAYNPTPAGDWCSLLTLDSNDLYQWHDANKLMVFIESEKLAARDFSALKCDAG